MTDYEAKEKRARLKAERNAEAVMPPCKIGDFIYAIPEREEREKNAREGRKNKVKTATVGGFLIYADHKALSTDGGLYMDLDYGKWWFFSKEAAKVRLEKLESKLAELEEKERKLKNKIKEI